MYSHVFDEFDVYARNHNVFRIDKNLNIIWQVTRIDHPRTNWELKHEDARKLGLPGCIEPFIRFYLVYPDGTRNKDTPLGILDDVADWKPGCNVELANLGFGTQWFSLDIDTGVAIEITQPGTKAW